MPVRGVRLDAQPAPAMCALEHHRIAAAHGRVGSQVDKECGACVDVLEMVYEVTPNSSSGVSEHTGFVNSGVGFVNGGSVFPFSCPGNFINFALTCSGRRRVLALVDARVRVGDEPEDEAARSGEERR